MNRRRFFKLLGVGAALASVPGLGWLGRGREPEWVSPERHELGHGEVG